MARGVGQSDPVDEVCIDFSPLRTIEVAQIAQDCLSEAQKYGSFQGSIDNSDVNGLGWNVSDIQTMLEEVSTVHSSPLPFCNLHNQCLVLQNHQICTKL